MGNIVGRLFGVVASKDYKTALAESVKVGNQAKFYLTQNNGANDQKALDDVTAATTADRNALVINGNTIQGISKQDINKLDAISDVTKIFKYQGSVKTREALLAKIPPSVKIGDVYNVEDSIMLNNISYPAHTNFVYIGLIDGENKEKAWDSLGGTMQIGTGALRSQLSAKTIHWEGENNIPIASLNLEVSTGLIVDTGGVLSVNIGTGLKLEGNKIAVKLATMITETYNTSSGGLYTNSEGGLYVGISSSEGANIKLLGYNNDGGLFLKYRELVKSLMANSDLKIYISSLIKDALAAQ